jgi:WhiB family redox-sensing transcriptional regulator
MSPEVLALLMRAPTHEFPVYWPNRPAWRDQAACPGVDPNVMVPRVENDVTTEAALRVCAGCPVREPCLAAALKDPNLLGVWGGLTTRERRELRAEGARREKAETMGPARIMRPTNRACFDRR